MWRLLFGLIAIPVLLLEFAVLRGETFSPWALANVAVYPAIVLVSIALHEAGHALAARLVGFQVPQVQIGVGRRLVAWTWGETRVTLHSFPIMGLTYLGSERERGVRWRYWLAIAAGPLVTFVVVACTSHDVGLTAAVAGGFAPRELVAFCNLLMLVLNLAPISFLFRKSGLFRNDGSQLLRVPFAPAKELAALREMPAILAAQEAEERGDREAAWRILEEALARHPDSWNLRNSLAVAHLHQGNHEKARAIFVELLATEPPTPELVWLARNNLAWANFCLADDTHSAEADLHSREVLERFKRAPWAMGTRGAVLGWLGKHDEAIALLERAYLQNSLNQHRASNAACAAISFAGLGRTEEATAWLERARKDHASCPQLARAQAAIEAGRKN